MKRRRVDRRPRPAISRTDALEASKLADVSILESDPYTVDPDTIIEIRASETWVGDKKMFG